ncbi:mCG117562, partial [Mus musculus]
FRTRPSSLSTPHLVIRRRSPRDPRITGLAGRVKWRPTWGTRYDCPPDNGLRIKEVPRRQRNSGTVHRHFTRVSSTDVGRAPIGTPIIDFLRSLGISEIDLIC